MRWRQSDKITADGDVMRVLHVISGLDHVTGGPAVALEGLAAAQQAAGLDVSVLATNWVGHSSDEAAARLTGKGIHVEQVGPCRRPFAYHPDIRSTLERLVPLVDVVHIHGLWEDVQHHASRISARLGKPYIIRPCGMLSRYAMAQGRLKKQLYLALRLRAHLNRASAIHYTADLEREEAARLHLKAHSLVLPNGVDLTQYARLPAAGTFRARHPEVGERPFVLFLSRIQRKKGLDYLIPAFARTQGHSMLVIAGPNEGGYEGLVRAMVKKFKCSLQECCVGKRSWRLMWMRSSSACLPTMRTSEMLLLRH
jgi:glycosyltransferase involved in cell wall biosynthesis